MDSAPSAFVAIVRRAALKIAVRISPRARVGTIEIIDLVDDGRAPTRLSKLAQALSRIEKVQPWRQALMKRHLRRVLIIPRGGQMYDFDLDACMVDAAFVEEQSLPSIAGALLHEAIHARVEHLGIRYRGAARERIERLATTAQVDFLRDAGEELLAESVSRAAETVWWTIEHVHARRMEQLKGYEAPGWVLALYRRMTGTSASGSRAARAIRRGEERE